MKPQVLLGFLFVGALPTVQCDGQNPLTAPRRGGAAHPSPSYQMDGAADANDATAEASSNPGDASPDGGDAVDAKVTTCSRSSPVLQADTGSCATGTAVDAWGTTVCLDLSNEVLFPGACSSRTKIIAVGNGDPSFVQSSCDATYVQGLLRETTCSSVSLNAHDVVAGGCGKEAVPNPSPTCEWYWDFARYNDVTFAYDPKGALLSTTSHAQGDMLDRVVMVDLTAHTVRTCDRDTNECSVRAASDRELQGARVSAEPEWLHPPGPQPDFAGTPCTTDGSIASGHVSQQCGTNTLDYFYDQRGRLTEYDWLSLNPDSYTAESEGRNYFDRAGNDRYSLYSSVSLAGVRGTTVAHEGNYECFPCSYAVPDGGLRVNVSSPDGGEVDAAH